MNIKNFLSKRINLLLFITFIFTFIAILLAYIVPGYLYQMNLKDVEEEIVEIAENHESITSVKGTNNLYIFIDGESTMLTANGYINEINPEVEVHLIHWSEIQEVETQIYYDDFQNAEFVYYIKVVDDDYYVVTFADTYDILTFVTTLRIYSLLFIGIAYILTITFSSTIFNNSLIKRYSLFNPITALNTQQAFYVKYAKKNLAHYYITYHNIYNFHDIVDACGVRYHDNILKMLSMNIKRRFEFDTIYQISPSEYIVISEEENDYLVFKESLNAIMSEAMPQPYEFKTKSVKIQRELLENIDIQTLINRLAYAYSKIKTSSETITEVNESILKEMDLEIYYQSNLEKALKEESLTNYYQIKVDPKTNLAIGAEALSRWLDEGSIISPTKYISIAETSGLIYDLDVLSFKKTCIFVSKLIQQRIVPDTFKISTNFSPITLKNLTIETVKSIVKESGVSPNNVSFEITESVVLEFDIIKELLYQVTDLGITIEIDDFSAGNSSFTVLPILNASYIKIDMAILPKDMNNQKETMIYESLVDIASRLDLKIISEGVETKAQVDYLTKQNIHAIQGYFYSRPIPEDEFITLLERYSKSSDK